MSDELLIELQMLGQQIKELDQYIQGVEQRIVETDQNIKDLELFKQRKENDDILVPIVPGIFTHASIKDKDKILIGVGKGVVIESTLDHAIDILKKQLEELTQHREEMINELNGLIERAKELEKAMKQ